MTGPYRKNEHKESVHQKGWKPHYKSFTGIFLLVLLAIFLPVIFYLFRSNRFHRNIALAASAFLVLVGEIVGLFHQEAGIGVLVGLLASLLLAGNIIFWMDQTPIGDTKVPFLDWEDE